MATDNNHVMTALITLKLMHYKRMGTGYHWLCGNSQINHNETATMEKPNKN